MNAIVLVSGAYWPIEHVHSRTYQKEKAVSCLRNQIIRLDWENSRSKLDDFNMHLFHTPLYNLSMTS